MVFLCAYSCRAACVLEHMLEPLAAHMYTWMRATRFNLEPEIPSDHYDCMADFCLSLKQMAFERSDTTEIKKEKRKRRWKRANEKSRNTKEKHAKTESIRQKEKKNEYVRQFTHITVIGEFRHTKHAPIEHALTSRLVRLHICHWAIWRHQWNFGDTTQSKHIASSTKRFFISHDESFSYYNIDHLDLE